MHRTEAGREKVVYKKGKEPKTFAKWKPFAQRQRLHNDVRQAPKVAAKHEKKRSSRELSMGAWISPIYPYLWPAAAQCLKQFKAESWMRTVAGNGVISKYLRRADWQAGCLLCWLAGRQASKQDIHSRRHHCPLAATAIDCVWARGKSNVTSTYLVLWVEQSDVMGNCEIESFFLIFEFLFIFCRQVMERRPGASHRSRAP